MRDLSLTEAAYGVGAGLFFIGYLLLQVPAGYLVKRIGVRTCPGASLVAWGIVSIATLATRNKTAFSDMLHATTYVVLILGLWITCCALT
jgi:MFS family permease